ncbi:bifunctional diaminohydroxyphosphoribosylaminopyrimidine deaminase/5-amino-6-(5-phosphoribosylamino)uracil reductase RibD [Gillisia sp. M10.2A]|uniref:Riboflavin biosynthesis protein RibD n=1 Tax=Gillisia lutea TaxID=2909668 RepID=A0ABS9EHI0_9FLAO|nr:bifunctional diaminohydroxyphosphoribosylaminopyrimidine deaminase/5-amino-6-(5-phosphoribosylamino)uracil reductase RibD [Gillisia lutea]MCF4100921.1 bifunctional diaminohydroxyphosphoribosylaminopyrimidine deaminase/5-amino-6-(5-phosphoribosylamino)uracil reductase RibD [Gillisia lutea]
MNIHEKYIKRCIQLAENGLGNTYPNPLVGSVLVYNDKIIGEGWHKKAGEPHAEVNAINAVKDTSLLKKATIYVSLEPCSHYGKTPPCSDLIIASGIKKVVIGSVDPFAKVAGKGIKKLLEAGCEVQVGILEKECHTLNKRFFTYHLEKRPYIILKWAKSKDGYLAPEISKEDVAKRQAVWITNKYSKQLVHKWRSEEQAILVGTNTAIADNPQLNTRLWKGVNPTRIAIDRTHRIPKDSNLFDGSVNTIIFCEENPAQSQHNIIYQPIDFTKELPFQICEALYTQEIQSVIIEGGSKTLQSFIDKGLWDEARVFTGSISFNSGTKAPQLPEKPVFTQSILNDTLEFYDKN